MANQPTVYQRVRGWVSRHKKLTGFLSVLGIALTWAEKGAALLSGATVGDFSEAASNVSQWLSRVPLLSWPAAQVALTAIAVAVLLFVVGVWLYDRRVAVQPAKLPHALQIEYDVKKNYILHPNGSAEARAIVRNTGSELAKRVRVKIESLVAQDNIKEAAPYARQFTACRLQVIREELGFSLQAGDLAEIRVIRAEKNADFFVVDGYTADVNKPGVFKTPRARYLLTIVVTSHDGGHDTKSFIGFPKKNGEMGFKLA